MNPIIGQRWASIPIALACVLVQMACPWAVQPSSAAPLVRAHAHNDYLHAQPLADALARGFWSVEADIWLTNGLLLVAHDHWATSPDRTLQRLYLEPLRAFVKTNATPRGTPPFTLLIDVKSEAETTYAALRQALGNYTDMLTRFESNTIRTNAVMAIISGNRAQATMHGESVRFAAVDGRLPDLEANPSAALVPLISDNWSRHFKWRGTGPLPVEEEHKLRELVARAHAQGRRIRFWSTPDNPVGWKVLHDAGVDLLNTDKLAAMEEFLRARQ